jgi:sugar/nucleoside kinase (ribokinase family)
MSKNILVVGSTAFDSVETAAGKAEKVLGGSAFFFSAAASFFANVALVGVVGEDFSLTDLDFLRNRGVDLAGLEVIPGGKTFHWGGRYHEDMKGRDTLFTHLNVFEDFNPVIPKSSTQAQLLFLANIQPELQLQVLNQMEKPELVITDTMNLWINIAMDGLTKVISRTDILIVNDEESEMITGVNNPLQAANKLLEMGPKTVIVKKGEHGALLINKEGMFHAPAFPLETITDPTGAGDTFAGGFVGSLARDGQYDLEALKRAVACGSVLASFSVQDFSIRSLAALDRDTLDRRLNDFHKLTQFNLI